MEIEVSPSCTGSLAYTTLDGMQKPPFLQRTPPSLRVTPIQKSSETAGGTRICLLLRPPCKTLEMLCGGPTCHYAVMNDRSSQVKCCPVGSFPSS